MMNRNFLAIVDNKADGSSYSHTISAEALGAPNITTVKSRLRKFYNTPPNIQYLYGTEIYLTDSTVSGAVQEVLNEFYSSFGTYKDTVAGIENQFKNLVHFQNYSYIAEIKNPGRCFIVGAGPSLDLTIDQLKICFDGGFGFIICCDAAYKKLIANGIEPDLVVTTERTDDCTPFFENLGHHPTNTKFLASIVSHPNTYNEWNRGAWAQNHRPHVFHRQMPEMLWLNLGYKHLSTSPFVTQTMTTLALENGFQEIVFVGQDFAYGPNGESHAAIGHAHIESVTKDYYKEVEGVDGGMVKTSYHLNNFGNDLEDLIRETKGITFINTSPIGRHLAGTKWVNLYSVGFRSLPKSEIVSYPIPLKPWSLRQRIESALTEIKNLGPIDPKIISSYELFADIGYTLLIQPYAAYMSACFQSPASESVYLKIFQTTAEQVKCDLIRILEGYLNDTKTA